MNGLGINIKGTQMITITVFYLEEKILDKNKLKT